jgi:hypothetical protein
MKAVEMARIYHSAHSRLAKQYGVTVVGGSIVLPSPKVENGILYAGSGKLYNVAALYRPDGTADAKLVYKAFPIEEELEFTSAGAAQDLPVFSTPAGTLGILICADSWYKEPYQVLASQKVELIAVQSYLFPDNAFTGIWPRADLVAPQFQTSDKGNIKEEEAWLKYSLPKHIQNTNAKFGMTVFLRGKLWELGSDGYTIIVPKDRLVLHGKWVAGATLNNVWLTR